MRLPALMIFLSYFILILTDILIIYDLKEMSLYDKYPADSKRRQVWWKIYSVFAALILILLTVSICLPYRSPDAGITANMWLVFIVLVVILCQIVYSIFSLVGFIPALIGGIRWNTGLWVGLPMAVLIFTMMWWGACVGRNKIHVERIEVSSAKLPASFNGYKIAQISDLHVGTWGEDTTFVAKLVDSVNNLHPNLIVFTGDLVNREAYEAKPFIGILSRLKAPDGVYSILGNHDYGDYLSWNSDKAKVANMDSLKMYQKEMGWKLLNNRHTSINNSSGESIDLIGVGNWGLPPFSQYGDLEKAYPKESFKNDKFKILLSHDPDHWTSEVNKKTNIDLTLSGHTHAMQVMFNLGNKKWSPAKFRYKNWGGLYENESEDGNKTTLYVNLGAGEVGMPMRIGATPEVTLITLLQDQ